MSVSWRSTLVAFGVTALLIGGVPLLELVLDEDLRHSDFPLFADNTWAMLTLALGAGSLVAVGLDVWRGRQGLEQAHPAWRTTFGLTGLALASSSGTFLLLLTPPTFDEPADVAGVFQNLSSIGYPVDLQPVDLRWTVVPLAVGLALLVSAAVAGRRPG